MNARIYTAAVTVAIAALVGLSGASLRAQDTNLPADTIPASTNRVVNAYIRFFDDVGEVIDIGATYTGKLETGGGDRNGDVLAAPSLSLLAKVPGWNGKWQITSRTDIDWCAGAAYTYVPKWDEHFGGIGLEAELLRLPRILNQAQTAIVVPAAPRLTLLKAFAAVEVKLDKLISEPEIAGSVGLTLPF